MDGVAEAADHTKRQVDGHFQWLAGNDLGLEKIPLCYTGKYIGKGNKFLAISMPTVTIFIDLSFRMYDSVRKLNRGSIHCSGFRRHFGTGKTHSFVLRHQFRSS